MGAFSHLKVIDATEAAQPLLDRAGVEVDEGATDLGVDFLAVKSLTTM